MPLLSILKPSLTLSIYLEVLLLESKRPLHLQATTLSCVEDVAGLPKPQEDDVADLSSAILTHNLAGSIL